jgi:hypothetical protein
VQQAQASARSVCERISGNAVIAPSRNLRNRPSVPAGAGVVLSG